MPYFFILPALALLLLALGFAVIVARATDRRILGEDLIGATLGLLAGFTAANVLVTLVGFAAAWLAGGGSTPVRQAIGVFAGATLILGPFVASAVGCGIGFLLGWRYVRRRRARRASAR